MKRTIRRASETDIPRVLSLLSQVLEIHARIRPDVFRHGTTKYSRPELLQIFQNDRTPVYVSVDEADAVLAYAFCVLRDTPTKDIFVPSRSLFVDDLCVDASLRGQGIGRELFDFLKTEAKRLGCSSLTLNVWEGNDPARVFYEKMGMRPRETQMELDLSSRKGNTHEV